MKAQTQLDHLVNEQLPNAYTLYKNLHAAPELSGQEEKTSQYIASHLKALGFQVTEKLGKFEGRPWQGYGVVGVLKNGKGPTVMVRTDMDALPLAEKTGLPYASNIKSKNDAGEEVDVMHACGHDIHMTVFLGAARIYSQLKKQWKGTIVMAAQPAEEAGPGASGAEAMMRDGLFTRFPKPDYILGLHQVPEIEAGKVGLTAGYTTCVNAAGEIIIKGIGAHAAKPHESKDPIVMSAELILLLQTMISRETNPLTPATFTIGSIKGGNAPNIIPDEVRMKFTLRTTNNGLCDQLITSILQKAKAVGIAAGLSADKMPIVNVIKGYPANYNNPELTARVYQSLSVALGNENITQPEPVLFGEDFSYYTTDKNIPGLFFFLGSADPLKFKQSKETGVPLPTLHSPYFAPSPELTIKTGIKAMTAAVLNLLSEKKS